MAFPRCFLMLALCLGLAACSGGRPEHTAEDIKQNTRYCLWTLTLKDPVLTQQVQDRLDQGEHLLMIGRDLASRHNNLAVLKGDCTKGYGLSAEALEALLSLQPGQVALPLPYPDRDVFIMRSTDDYRRRGAAFFNEQNYGQAEELLLEDVRLHPDSASSWHMIALSRAAQGKLPQALAALDSAQRFAPDNALLYKDQADIVSRLKSPDAALALYEKAHMLAPGEPRISAALARALYEAGQDLPRAERMARRAVEDDPADTETWLLLSQISKANRNASSMILGLYHAAVARPHDKQLLLELAEAIVNAGPQALAQIQALLPAEKNRTEDVLTKIRPEADRQEVALLPREQGALEPQPPAEPGRADSGQSQPEPQPALARAYYVRVATMANERLGEAELNRWRQQGFNAHMRPWRSPKGTQYYLINIGPYASRNEATASAESLKSQHQLKDYRISELTIKTPDDKTPAPAPAAAAESAPAQSAPAPETLKTYYIRVASLPDLDSAHKEISMWRNYGYEPLSEEWQSPDQKIWHLVNLGPYYDHTKAESEAELLIKRKYITSYRIVERDNRSAAGSGRSTFGPAQKSREPGVAPAEIKFYIRAATHLDKGPADKEAEQWIDRGLSAFVESWRTPDNTLLYFIYLGPYEGRSSATAKAEELKSQGLLNSYFIAER